MAQVSGHVQVEALVKQQLVELDPTNRCTHAPSLLVTSRWGRALSCYPCVAFPALPLPPRPSRTAFCPRLSLLSLSLLHLLPHTLLTQARVDILVGAVASSPKFGAAGGGDDKGGGGNEAWEYVERAACKRAAASAGLGC